MRVERVRLIEVIAGACLGLAAPVSAQTPAEALLPNGKDSIDVGEAIGRLVGPKTAVMERPLQLGPGKHPWTHAAAKAFSATYPGVTTMPVETEFSWRAIGFADLSFMGRSSVSVKVYMSTGSGCSSYSPGTTYWLRRVGAQWVVVDQKDFLGVHDGCAYAVSGHPPATSLPAKMLPANSPAQPFDPLGPKRADSIAVGQAIARALDGRRFLHVSLSFAGRGIDWTDSLFAAYRNAGRVFGDPTDSAVARHTVSVRLDQLTFATRDSVEAVVVEAGCDRTQRSGTMYFTKWRYVVARAGSGWIVRSARIEDQATARCM